MFSSFGTGEVLGRLIELRRARNSRETFPGPHNVGRQKRPYEFERPGRVISGRGPGAPSMSGLGHFRMWAGSALNVRFRRQSEPSLAALRMSGNSQRRTLSRVKCETRWIIDQR